MKLPTPIEIVNMAQNKLKQGHQELTLIIQNSLKNRVITCTFSPFNSYIWNICLKYRKQMLINYGLLQPQSDHITH